MLRHIKHAVRHSGFIQKHPVVTFLLMVTGVATVAEVAIKATSKTPSTSQPIQTGGA